MINNYMRILYENVLKLVIYCQQYFTTNKKIRLYTQVKTCTALSSVFVPHGGLLTVYKLAEAGHFLCTALSSVFYHMVV